MAKNDEFKHDDTYDIGSTMGAGPSDEPPIDESNYECVTSTPTASTSILARRRRRRLSA